MKVCFSLLLLFFICTASATAAPLRSAASAGYAYDSNVTRAELAGDIEKDSIVNVDADSSVRFSINDTSYFSLRGSLEANQFVRFTRLSNLRLGIHGSYHLRLSSGYTAMRYLGRLSYVRRLYKSDQRNGSAIEAELGISKRFTDSVTLRAGFIKQDISADSVVFDTTNNRFYADVDFRITKTFNMYVTLGFISGDVASTARPTQELIDASSAIVLDDAFRELKPDRFAYKVSADTITFKIGETISLASNQAFDGSLMYYNTSGYRGHDYVGLLLSLNYLYRF